MWQTPMYLIFILIRATKKRSRICLVKYNMAKCCLSTTIIPLIRLVNKHQISMNMLSKYILALSLTLGAITPVGAEPPRVDHCAQFVPFGYPVATDNRATTPLCRISYFTLHDNLRKVPVYSAELLIPENVSGEAPRKNNFRPEPQLNKGQRAENDDYRYSGYDRGHMAPAEDFRRNSVLMSQSFYLSNMIPQNPGLNRGMWRMLEFYVVTRVRNGESLYVITGPVYDGPVMTIGGNKVYVPSHVFKVIVNTETKRSEAYLIPNRDMDGQYVDFKVSISTIERKAKISLLPLLNDVKLTSK